MFGTGIVHAAAYSSGGHDPLETTRRALLDMELDVIEGAWPADGPARDELRNLLCWSGCDIVYAAGGVMRRQGIDPSAADPDARRVAIEKLKAIVETASWYGAHMLLVCAGPDTEPDRRSEGIQHLSEALREVCRHAERIRPDNPLWITFEHFDRELDQKRLLGPTKEARAMIADIRRDHRNIGMTLDLSHIVQLGEDIEVAVAAAGELVIHAHVANCGLDRSFPTAFGDSHCRFGMPGGAVGLEDVIAFLTALIVNGYGSRPVPTRMPVISVEMKTPEGEPPEVVLANGLRMLRLAAAHADIRLSNRSATPQPVAPIPSMTEAVQGIGFSNP
ncbi:MAG TPA: sugar phosphate isomerase/epimerase [Mycoplana sp.]|nr:sugar phosphate isomerase/epimerase [Mycoplana sp.]